MFYDVLCTFGGVQIPCQDVKRNKLKYLEVHGIICLKLEDKTFA